MLDKIEEGEIKGFISSITIAELFCIFARFKDVEFARGIIRHVRISKFKIVSMDDKMAEISGEFKFKYTKKEKKGLPIADALIAATSVVKKAILIAEEEHYFKIKEIDVKTPAQFLSEKL
ncbi:MAG: PIN domain-containing protein [Candidatus Aenigmarchaeota archaeon]|nr:PIN domain-containing protein [Candidatus Aenigmarchaeota archaeon]